MSRNNIPQCSICLDVFTYQEMSMAIPCAHWFCKNCIEQLPDELSNKCSKCRAKITQWISDPFKFMDHIDTVYYPFSGGPLSNFYNSPFTIDGMNFSNGEKWMMHTKAKVFKDTNAMELILNTTNPKTLKSLGRKVKNYNEETWNREGLESGELRRGWIEKFKQNPKCLEELKKSKGMKIVEASPWDKKWGIGLGVNNPKVHDSSEWRGLNLLGKELDKIRIELCGS